MKSKLLCIVGPTASGKTALSIALAKALNGEIISGDSMQIYRGLSIGTAKPDLAEQAGIPHHMLDICDISQPFSAAEYARLGGICVEDIQKRGKTPLVVGGTGLYINALLEGSPFAPKAEDAAFREEMLQKGQSHGAAYLHNLLAEIDPESSEKIHQNNIKRVIRALEIYHTTGKPMSVVNRENKQEPRFEGLMIGVCPKDRALLYDRIDQRVDAMVENGILEEARRLFDWESPSLTALQAIGYKEFFPFFKGEAPLVSCVEKLKQNSRNYAKRQLTWFGHDDRVFWIYYEKDENFHSILHKATKYYEENIVK